MATAWLNARRHVGNTASRPRTSAGTRLALLPSDAANGENCQDERDRGTVRAVGGSTMGTRKTLPNRVHQLRMGVRFLLLSLEYWH